MTRKDYPYRVHDRKMFFFVVLDAVSQLNRTTTVGKHLFWGTLFAHLSDAGRHSLHRIDSWLVSIERVKCPLAF